MTLGHVVQALWIGSRLSRMEQLAIRSFLACGHEYHLYSYGAVENVPPGVVSRDANEIIPSSRIFKYRDHDSYAGFSNYFRYTLLLERGGWWVDTDLVCLRPFDFEDDYVFSSQLAPPNDGGGEHVNVGAIKAPAGSSVLQYALQRCLEKDPGAISWGETGPALFADAVRQCGLTARVRSAVVFCPISWFEWTDIINPDRTIGFDERTHAVHLWNEMWRRGGFDKDDDYDPGCLYQRLQATHLPAGRGRLMAGSAPSSAELPPPPCAAAGRRSSSLPR